MKLMRTADNKLHQEQFYGTTLCNRSLEDLNNVLILVASLFVLIIFKAQPKIELLNLDLRIRQSHVTWLDNLLLLID